MNDSFTTVIAGRPRQIIEIRQDLLSYRPHCRQCRWRGKTYFTLGMARRACEVHRHQKGCEK